MTTQAVVRADRSPAAGRPGMLLLLLGAVLAAAAATVSALGALEGNKLELVVPLAVVIGALAGAVAITRFGIFVMLMLALRASVDVSKLASPDASPTTTSWLSTRVLTPSTLMSGVFLVASALWILAQMRAGRLQRVGGQGRAWLLFALAGFLSLLASTSRFHSMVAATQVLSIAMMYVVLEQLMTQTRRAGPVLTAVYASALVPVLYTLAGFAVGHPGGQLKDGFFRITGTFTETNDFGRYLMLLLLSGIALFGHVRRRWRWAFGALVVACGVLMLLTFTLTAIFGAVLGLLVLGLWHNRKALVILAVASVCAVALSPQLVARVQSVSTSTSYFAASHHNNSLLWRFSYWSEVLPLANSNPITGIGLDMTGMSTEQSMQPHNDFLRAYVEEGVVGELTYLVLLGSMAVAAVRATRASPRGSLDRSIGAGYLACVVALTAGSIGDNVFNNVAVMWYLVALGAAAGVVARRRQEATVASRTTPGRRGLGPVTRR